MTRCPHVNNPDFSLCRWLQHGAGILTFCIAGISLCTKAQPILITNLANQVVIAGTPVVLQISASDSDPLNYQWYFNGAIISGATNASVFFDSIQLTNAGRYSVTITDPIDSLTSRTNTLTVENYPLPTTIVAWGDGLNGQTNVPATETNVVAVSASSTLPSGPSAIMILRRDGTLEDFGWEIAGPGTYSLLPRAAFVCASGDYGTGIYGLALSTYGTPFSFGTTFLGGASDVPSSVTNAVAVAGFNPALALLDNGTVVGWLPQPSWIPLDPGNILNSLPTLSNIVAIAMSGAHCLALTSNRTVLALGSNGHGESTVPTGLSNVAAISAGLYHSVALRMDGTVVAWGDNSSNQCNVPSGLSNVVAISAGNYHTLALQSNGFVIAWGDNSHGQCTIPLSLSNVVYISAGGNDSVALTKQPAVFITPTNQPVVVQSNVTFGTYATGYPTLSYQWLFDETNIIGATNSSFTITNAQLANQGNYSVIASNLYGASTSPIALLTVYSTASPILSSVSYGPKYFHFLVSGVPGYFYVVQVNTNLTSTNWVSLSTNTSPFTFSDHDILTKSIYHYRTRFYRAFYLP